MTVPVGGSISLSANFDGTGTSGSLGAGWLLHVNDMRPDWASEPLTVDESGTIHVMFDWTDIYNMGSSGATTAGVYWATGPDASDIIDGAPPLKQYDVRFFDEQGNHLSYVSYITRDMYASPPEGATHIVAVVDRASDDNPHGQIPENDETDNAESIRIPRLGIDVSAQYDDAGTPDDEDFGQYLEGIKLDNTFTITTQPSNEADIKLPEVAYLIAEVDGAPTYLEVPADGGNGAKVWKFTYDVGQLSQDTPLVITAYDANGEPIGSPYKGMLHASEVPDVSVKADYPGGPSDPVDLSALRFIRGVPLDVTYTGSVTDLSKFYVEQNKLPKVQVGSDQVDVTWTNTGDRTWTFTTHDDASNLPEGDRASKLFLLTRNGGGGYSKPADFPEEDIRSVSLPGWMGSAGQDASFNSAVSDVFAATAGAYVIKPEAFSRLFDFHIDLGSLAGSDNSIVNDLVRGLKSTFSLSFNAEIYVQPLRAVAPVGRAEDPTAHVQLLAGAGDDPSAIVLDHDFAEFAKNLILVLGLDNDTLNTQTVKVVTASPIDLLSYIANTNLFRIPFGGNRRFALPLPVFAGSIFKFYVQAGLKGEFRADVTELSLGASIQLDVGSGDATLNAAASTLSLRAAAKTSLILQKAQGELGINAFGIIDVPILSAAAEGRLSAALSGGWTVNLAGGTVAADASLTIDGYLRYDVALLGEADPSTSDFEPIELKPIIVPLYDSKGKKPPTLPPDVSDPKQVTSQGTAHAGQTAYPGVQPTKGNLMAVINVTDAGGALVPTGFGNVGGITIGRPVGSDLTHIQADVNLLADTPGLAFGSHFVETVLTDDQGDEAVIDSRDIAYLWPFDVQANDNPLGYSGGWATYGVDVPDGLLQPGRLYSVGFRLVTDPIYGDHVGLAIDNAVLIDKRPRLTLSTPSGDLGDGLLDFGTETPDPSSAVMTLLNDGEAQLQVDSISIVGAGFALDDDGLPASFTLPIGVPIDIHIRALNPGASAVDTLLIQTDLGPRAITLLSNASVALVTNANDSGPGSLRDAIIAANIADRPTQILFRIDPTDPNFVDADSSLAGGDSDPDVFVIKLQSGLPALGSGVGGVTIDGFSQAAYLGETNPFGPEIVLDGSNVSYDGLTTGTSNNAILGLNIQGFHGSGISIFGGSSNTIQGNYIGTDPTGTLNRGNANQGILLAFGASNNQIGGGAPGQGNVISGNGGFGVWMVGSDVRANRVQGNFIGLSADGAAALGNGSDGLVIQDSPGNSIGGAGAGEGNVISGNNRFGVWVVSTNAAGNVLQGNRIGTDAAGSKAIGNGADGLIVQDAPGNTIGGASAGAGNLISGNNRYGVWVIGANAAGNIFQGNRIGTDATGTSRLGNRYEGLFLWDAPATTVGGTTPGAGNLLSGNGGDGLHIVLSHATGSLVAANLIGTDVTGVLALGNGGAGVSLGSGASSNVIGLPAAGNTIAFNSAPGVLVRDDSSGNAIRGNVLRPNGGLAIDLWGDGPTANDPGDADTGPNGLQNTPTLASASSGSSTHVVGSVSGAAGVSLTIDVYASGGLDPSGRPLAERWLGAITVVTDPSGHASFDANLAGATVAGEWLTATATGAEGTSELSGAVVVVEGDTTPPVISTLPAVAPNPRNTSVETLDITFSEPIDLATFDWHDLSLTRDGGANLITGAVGVGLVSGTTYRIGNLGALTAAEGNYELTVDAGGIADPVGNAGVGSSSTSWVMDTTPPSSRVLALPATSSPSFTVSWSGADAVSGIAAYDIWASVDGGPFARWLTATTATSATYAGTAGHTYGFYSVATDVAGNVEATPTSADATTQVVSSPIGTTTTVQSNEDPSMFGESVTFTATVSPAQGSGTPTGSVQFSVDGSTFGTPVALINGMAMLTTSSLAVGSHTVTSAYTSDTDQFITSTGSLAGGQVVNKDGSTATLSSSANSSVFNQSINFTVTVTAAVPGSGTPTGTVQFLIDGTRFGSAVTLVNGTATSGSISTLKIGNHTITAGYSGDASFTAVTAPGLTQVVNKDNTTTTLDTSISPSVYGQSVTFTATVAPVAPGTSTPTGSVTFYNGSTSLGTGTLSGGSARYTTTKLPTGADSITAVYNGNATFASSASPALNQAVNPDGSTTVVTASANPSVFGQSVTFTATVTANTPGSGTATGSVTFMDGSNTLGKATLSGGKATFKTTSLAVGSHSVTAVYGGDTNFLSGTSAALGQVVNQDGTSTSLSSSVNPSVYGQSVTFTATVKPTAPGGGTPTGTVTFMDGSTALGTGTLTSGKATFKTNALAVGSHQLTVVYGGDTNFLTGTSPVLTETVNQDATTTRLKSSANPSVYGQSVKFTATVGAASPGSGTPTGIVTFMDGSTAIGSGILDGTGTASFTTSSLSVGSHAIAAVYGGDGNFTTSNSAATSQAVNQAGTTTTAVSSANPSVYGQPVTFTATVTAATPGSGTPTGTVTFVDGTTTLGTATLGGGTASFSISTLPVGAHSIKAVYAGDTNFKTSTSAARGQSVNQAGTSTALGSSLNPSGYGQSVTFTASLGAVAPGNGTPTGTVTFYDGSKKLWTVNLSDGVAGFTTSTLTIGTHPIKAVYSGDTDFKTSTSAVLSQVVQISAGAAGRAAKRWSSGETRSTEAMGSTVAAAGSTAMTSTTAARGTAPAGASGAAAATTVIDLVIAALGDDAASGTSVEDLARERVGARSRRLVSPLAGTYPGP